MAQGLHTVLAWTEPANLAGNGFKLVMVNTCPKPGKRSYVGTSALGAKRAHNDWSPTSFGNRAR